MVPQGLKQHIVSYADEHIYFSLERLIRHLSSKKIAYKENTLKQYLYDLVKEQKLFDAGKGWYSSIQDKCGLETVPVKDIVQQMQDHFPLLSFSCWSTRQLQPYVHHLQAGFIVFIYTDKDALEAVTTQLMEEEYHAFENPRKRDFDRFVTQSGERQLIIVRPSISQEPVEGHFATMEKILVDLLLEKDRSFLMDHQEYDRILHNLINRCRINMASLLRYAGRRRVREAIEEILDL